MKGLKIRTVTGTEIEVFGTVEFNQATGVYYCAGQSWPQEIVEEVL